MVNKYHLLIGLVWVPAQWLKFYSKYLSAAVRGHGSCDEGVMAASIKAPQKTT